MFSKIFLKIKISCNFKKELIKNLNRKEIIYLSLQNIIKVSEFFKRLKN